MWCVKIERPATFPFVVAGSGDDGSHGFCGFGERRLDMRRLHTRIICGVAQHFAGAPSRHQRPIGRSDDGGHPCPVPPRQCSAWVRCCRKAVAECQRARHPRLPRTARPRHPNPNQARISCTCAQSMPSMESIPGRMTDIHGDFPFCWPLWFRSDTNQRGIAQNVGRVRQSGRGVT